MKYIVLVGLFLLLSLYAKAQFVPKGSEWNYVSYSLVNGYPESFNYKIIAALDTTIQGKIYSKLVGPYDTVYLSNDNGKVFYYKLNQHNLLFDFNAKIKDTLTLQKSSGYNNPIETFKVVIDTITTIKDIFNTELKDFKYTVIVDSPFQWVATNFINSKFLVRTSPHGLWTTDITEGLLEHHENFYCYSEPNGYRFLLIDSAECNTVGIPMMDEPLHSLLIYPNPATDIIHICTQQSNSSIKTISLYDVVGKLILHKNDPSNTIELNVQSLPPGMYWLNIKHNSIETTTQKIIINR